MYILNFDNFQRSLKVDRIITYEESSYLTSLKKIRERESLFNWTLAQVEDRRNSKWKGRKWELTNFIQGVNIIVRKIYIWLIVPRITTLLSQPLLPRSDERSDLLSKLQNFELIRLN